MKDIAIFGAGGLGREVACLIKSINKKKPTWNFIGFYDDGLEVGIRNRYGVVLGGVNDLNNSKSKLSVVIAIGNPKIVSEIVSKINNNLIDFPNLISPDIIFLDREDFSIGKGNIVLPGSLVSCNVKIGDFNLLNGLIQIGHDTKIGNYNSIMPSVRISGDVIIGNYNFFGVNSVVLQQVEIGSDTKIAASSLILKNTKDGSTYLGNPAKIIF